MPMHGTSLEQVKQRMIKRLIPSGEEATETMTPEVGTGSVDQNVAFEAVCGGVPAGPGQFTKMHIAWWTWAGSGSFAIDAMTPFEPLFSL